MTDPTDEQIREALAMADAYACPECYDRPRCPRCLAEDVLAAALRKAQAEIERKDKALMLVHDSVTITQDQWRERYYHIPKDVIIEADKALTPTEPA